MPGHPNYVFAYGSNLWKDQMLSRCPDSHPVCTSKLRGFRLTFVGQSTHRWGRGGVATVVPQAGSVVSGAIYQLSAADEVCLDGFEGVAQGHYVKDRSLLLHDDRPVLAYIATRSDENRPNGRYLAAILAGYADWGLDPSALEQLETYPADD